ncbi:MAG: hypothetical protein PHC73_03580, partial [Immundisolibacter sp.]
MSERLWDDRAALAPVLRTGTGREQIAGFPATPSTYSKYSKEQEERFMSDLLAGRVVIVTGAARGIGQA